MTNKQLKICEEQMSHYGFAVCRDIFQEELAELLERTNSNDLYLSKWSSESVIEEFADVVIMSTKMCLYFGESGIENYVENYEHKDSMFESVETLTWLQKTAHMMKIVSKSRRDGLHTVHEEFRASLYLICEHVLKCIKHLEETGAEKNLKAISDTIDFKLDRQQKRIDDEP